MWIKGERAILWFSLGLLAVIMYWPVFSSSRLPGGEMSDTVAQGYPFFAYTVQRLSQGELPLWNPYILCGTPFYESFSSPVFYPLRGLPLILLGAEAAIRFLFPVHLVLAGFFAWLFLKATGLSRWGAYIGSVAYASGAWANTLFYAGHGSKIICWAWLPLILWSVHRAVITTRWKYVGVGAIAVGMQGLSSHPQMMLYSAGCAAALATFLTGKPLKKTIPLNAAFLGIIFVLGGALAAVQLYPGYLFSRHTPRGTDLSLDAAASYSLPPEETLTMAFPGMFGLRHGFPDSSINGIPLYFGRLGLRLSSEFMGVVFFILGVLGLINARGKPVAKTLAALCITGAVVSWGGYTPVFGVLYKILPVFRKLRAPHMAAFVTTSSLALAAGFGFDSLFGATGTPAARKRIWLVLMWIAGVMLVLTAAAEPISKALQNSWWNKAGVTDTSQFSYLVSARASLLEKDFLRTAAVAAVLSFLVFLKRREKAGAAVSALCVVILGSLELIPFNRSFQVYLPGSSIEAMYPESPALSEMTGDGRIFPGSNSFIPLGLRSVTGYHAAKTIETDILMSLVSQSSPWVIRQTAMNTFATAEGAATWEQIQPVLAEGIPAFPNDPMPRAFIPRSIVSGSAEDGFASIEGGLNPEIRSVIQDSPSMHDGVLGTAEIILDEPEHVEIRTVTNAVGYLVLADTWYPRWTARVDGEEAQVFKANGWMRAVAVPQGEHVVEFIYDDSHIKTGVYISLAALLAVIAALFAGGRKNA